MTTYCRLIGAGDIEVLPRGYTIKADGREIINPSPSTLAQHGWKPLVSDDAMPVYDPETQYLAVVYTDDGDCIRRHYEARDIMIETDGEEETVDEVSAV